MTAWAVIAAWLALSALAGGVYAWLHWRKSTRALRKWKRRAERTHRYHENMRRLSHTNN